MSITEEREDELVAAITDKTNKLTKQLKDAAPKSLPKLPTFSGLGKKLNKDGNKPSSKQQQQNGIDTNITHKDKVGTASNRNSLVDNSEIKPMANGPITLELNETEKVSLVSDSLQQGDDNEYDHVDNGIPLVALQEKESATMQVSSV